VQRPGHPGRQLSPELWRVLLSIPNLQHTSDCDLAAVPEGRSRTRRPETWYIFRYRPPGHGAFGAPGGKPCWEMMPSTRRPPILARAPAKPSRMRSSSPTRCVGALRPRPDCVFTRRLRRRRANYLIRQSRRVGVALQFSSPAGVWLRKRIGSTHWAQKRTEQLFDHALRVDLPELAD